MIKLAIVDDEQLAKALKKELLEYSDICCLLSQTSVASVKKIRVD